MGREQDILEFLFDQISTTIVNHEPLNARIVREVEALSTWDHCDPRLTDHDQCEPDEPCSDMGSWPDEEEVGGVVADHIGRWLDDEVSDETLRNMLGSIIDIHNIQMVRLLGDIYIPDGAQLLRRKILTWQGLA